MLLSWVSLSDPQRNWRKCRDAFTINTVADFWFRIIFMAKFGADGRAILCGRGSKRLQAEFEQGNVL
jgi:hypothetical protein